MRPAPVRLLRLPLAGRQPAAWRPYHVARPGKGCQVARGAVGERGRAGPVHALLLHRPWRPLCALGGSRHAGTRSADSGRAARWRAALLAPALRPPARDRLTAPAGRPATSAGASWVRACAVQGAQARRGHPCVPVAGRRREDRPPQHRNHGAGDHAAALARSGCRPRGTRCSRNAAAPDAGDQLRRCVCWRCSAGSGGSNGAARRCRQCIACRPHSPPRREAPPTPHAARATPLPPSQLL